MDPNNSYSKTIRVVMFPWLAYGHITPYLELAKRLITNSPNSFTIYICSTPANLTCIEKKITPNMSNSIKLAPFNMPTSPGLPVELHTTNGLPGHLIPRLWEALCSASSVSVFSDTLASLKPDLLIYDCFQPWAASVAKDQTIPAVEFVTSGAASTCHLYHLLLHPGREFPFPKIYHRDYDDKEWIVEVLSNPGKKKRVLEGALVSNKIVLIKGSRDIEGKYMDYVSSLVGNKYVAVGPLVQEPSPDEKQGDHDEIVSWLDKKERRSTVFVSFGSESFLSKEEIGEVARGLELSKTNFIWVLRFPKGDQSVSRSALPKGFLDRVGDKGRILEWAPQAKILRHASGGGFVSHCGWNSVMESMHFGVPIIAMPMHFDQPANARLVEEVGVGVEVLRDKNGRFLGEDLAVVIRRVVVEESGRFVRRRAAEIGEKLRYNRGHEIDEVVRELVSLCNKG